MVEFEAVGNHLYLLYTPRDGVHWVFDKFDRGEKLTIKGTFTLERRHLVETDDEHHADADIELPLEFDVDDNPTLRFVVATIDGEYFRIDPEVLQVSRPVLIDRSAKLTWKWFTSEQRTSIIDIIAELRPSRIVIGGSEADAIPLTEYQRFIERFPNSHELKRYVLARVAAVVREYTDAHVDAESLYHSYVEKRLNKKALDIKSLFRKTEELKYRYLLDRLRTMLDQENTYTEAAWQREILQIVLLINPKYIVAFERVPVRDYDRNTMRQLDIMLVDASGNIDVIEIKRPFGKAIVTDTVYRDNHIPMRELSGSVMQLEKYILHLNRWGPTGEQALTKKFAGNLPPGFKIRINHPCGIIIMGRDANLSVAQRRDFDVVRRKYKNVMDIVTYDDLLRRLEYVIKQLQSEATET